MKQAFIDKNFSTKSLVMIQQANTIITQYVNQGYRLSLRQVYYQMVSRDLIPNTVQSYNNLGSLLTDARLAGYVDWDAIEDRGRVARGNSHWSDPASILRSASYSYQIDKWEDQSVYVEVMVEKDALSGVLLPVCGELDIRFTANKGYSSASAMYEASKRLLEAGQAGKDVYILYLGDHDPSGIDMTRDVRERLRLFLGIDAYIDGDLYEDDNINALEGFEVERLALNMDQVTQYDPPPNPAKTSDSRFSAYLAKFGSESWELDALEPSVLAGLVRDAVYDLRDETRWQIAVAKEQAQKDALMDYAKAWEAEHKDESSDDDKDDDEPDDDE